MADSSPRLLALSDDAALLTLLGAVLPREGLTVRAAATRAALDALPGEADERTALVLLDLRTPDAAALAQDPRLREVPRLLLLGSEQQLATAPAAEGLLLHPVSEPLLLAQVRTLLRLSRAEARVRALSGELASRAKLLDAALASAVDAFSIYDRDRRLVFLNPAAAGRPGVPLDTLLGRRARELPLDPVSLESFARDLDSAYDTGRMVRGRGKLPRPGNVGGWRYTEYLVTPALGEDGQVEAAVVVSRDVTEQRRAEEFREQFIGILGHDLRNPLNAISMTAQHLQRLGALAAFPQQEERLTQATARMQRMIRQLLDFARARLGGQMPIVRAPVDLFALVRGTVEELQAAHPDRTIALETRGQGQGLWDRDRLEQVVGNLLANALRYSPADSTVHVEVDGERDEALHLRVHNGGAPIPAELLPHLFEPFRRAGGEGAAPATGEGLGLGLYITDQVVRAHGGRTAVQSSAEAGTTLTVSLPRS
jgi:phosphoserine phosphatase RsbU/P